MKVSFLGLEFGKDDVYYHGKTKMRTAMVHLVQLDFADIGYTSLLDVGIYKGRFFWDFLYYRWFEYLWKTKWSKR